MHVFHLDSWPLFRRRVGIILVIVVPVGLGLIPLRAAHGNLWVDITVDPDPPRVGDVTTVHVQTLFLPNTSSCLDDPAAAPTARVVYTGDDWYHLDTFEISATSPQGKDQGIHLRRDPRDPSLWTGMVTFDHPGSWTLEMAMPYFPHIPVPDPCTGGAIVVDVLPTDAWATLCRPLHLPTTAPGSTGPRTKAQHVSPHVGPGAGGGPGEVRFDWGANSAVEMHLEHGGGVVGAPGGYAHQEDGAPSAK